VRDQHQRHAALALQPAQQVEDLAWIVTSSAVVGSSAMSRRGLQAMAIAIITRWFMPPESWCGKSFSRLAAAGMPTCSSSSTCGAAPRGRRD